MSLAVLIPIYRNFLLDYELLAIKNNIKKLSGYDCFFIAPRRLKNDTCFLNILKEFDVGVHYFEDKFFKDIDGYNNLMMDINFYLYYKKYKYMLICQMDALILKNNLDYWVSRGYDFIGAPWFSVDEKYFFELAGNGGLSLRKVERFIDVLSSKKSFFKEEFFLKCPTCFGLKNLFFLKLTEKFGFLLNVSIFKLFYKGNEDFFWAFAANFFVKDEFKVACSSDALNFAFEVNPRKCFEINGGNFPFGCHAFQRYDLEFWKTNFPEIFA